MPPVIVLHRREPHALGVVRDGLALRPARSVDAPSELLELGFGHVDHEWTDFGARGGFVNAFGKRHVHAPWTE
jgi:hypothetical protein